MRPVSARFLAALTQSHDMAVRVDVHAPDGTLLYGNLPIEGGSVTADRSSECRYTCSVTVPDLSLVPYAETDLLTAYGNRLAVYRGVRFADGDELVPVGLYRIDDEKDDVDDGPITLTGKGIECSIIDDRFTQNFPVVAGSALVSVASSLILDAIPGAAFQSLITSPTVASRTWEAGADKWAAIRELAVSAEADVYADAQGTFTIAAIPDIATAEPVWEVAAGEGGVLVSAERGMTRDGVYNGVQVSGENTADDTSLVSSLVVDDDPASPTYWGGPFGRKPYRHSSSLITSVSQAEGVAIALLRDLRAPNASIDLSAVPNPALEPGDCLRVLTSDGLRDLHLIQSLEIPLTPDGAMTISTISRKKEPPDG